LQSQPELEQFSSTVEKIYDAALDPHAWSMALRQIADLVGADGASIGFADLDKVNMGATTLHSIGFSEFYNNAMGEYGQVWALQTGLPFWQVGEVRHLPDILPNEELINGRFHREILSKENHFDYIGMLAVKDGPRFAPFTLTTKFETGIFNHRSVELARLLSSHICKSAKIGYALELKALQVNKLEATLDNLSSGIYLVHRDGRIVFMNKSAEQQITRGIGLNIVNNRITPKNSTAAAQLVQAMASEQEIGSSPVSIALPDDNGGMLATILRLDKGVRQNLASGSNPALFAIFVQNPEIASPIPGEAFAKLYGLTNAELRITLALAPGLGPQGAADILGLSVTTVKSHLQHIFTKTGTNKQADLMQLLTRASAPVLPQ
jgi:DNA-binding CsgD family transcriptional regulator/PAS domain-containing protein